MRKKIKIADKVCTVSSSEIKHVNQKQSFHSRKMQILQQLGEDSRKWELNFRMNRLNRMAKLNLI